MDVQAFQGTFYSGLATSPLHGRSHVLYNRVEEVFDHLTKATKIMNNSTADDRISFELIYMIINSNYNALNCSNI